MMQKLMRMHPHVRPSDHDPHANGLHFVSTMPTGNPFQIRVRELEHYATTEHCEKDGGSPAVVVSVFPENAVCPRKGTYEAAATKGFVP